ncbi:transcriptional regulator [Marine Group I thaumarchaeote]|uniref:Transcriptional regulator n=1 Tax=Marine Group I thaumarchaeote TaxID=2511932 RepID=A0A7K4N0I9_9ARCH|nr:transcriptional regulator [Marine Group I thaumarchaeote]
MGNDKNVGVKKEKGIRKLTDRISFWKAKSQADEEERHSPKPKPKLKKIKAKTKQAKNKKFQVIEAQRKANEAKKKEARIKVEAQRKANEAKIEAQRKAKKAKIEAQRKAKEAKKKEARIKVEAQKKAKEEAKKKEEEAKKKEEEAKRTYEDELEEQLSEEEITGFQLEKTDMDKMCNRVCEMIAGYETNGTLQSELWKKLKLSSRDGSRLALKLERMGMITREKILEKERWTYKLIIKKIPVSTKSIEGAPCLTCPVQSKCSIDGEISPKTCQWIEDWVMIELKNK